MHDELIPPRLRSIPNALEYTVLSTSPFAADHETRCAACHTVQKRLPVFHESRGSVRISAPRSLHALAGDLGECADPRCGCYRLSRPQVRASFRELVVGATCKLVRQAGAKHIHYVTVGSGQLLTDFEILCDLWAAGFRVESIIAIDTQYEDGRDDGSSCSSYSHGGSGGSDGDGSKRHGSSGDGNKRGGLLAGLSPDPEDPNVDASRALSQLAAFFAPAKVLAFASLDGFCTACDAEPAQLCRANAFVRCDAAAVDSAKTLEAAARSLMPGALAFLLDNTGQAHSCGGGALESRLPEHLQAPAMAASCRVWRRRQPRDQNEAAQHPGELEDVSAHHMLPGSIEGFDNSSRRRQQAAEWLAATQLERAQREGLKVYRVTYSAGRAPVRDRCVVRSVDAVDAVDAMACGRDACWPVARVLPTCGHDAVWTMVYRRNGVCTLTLTAQHLQPYPSLHCVFSRIPHSIASSAVSLTAYMQAFSGRERRGQPRPRRSRDRRRGSEWVGEVIAAGCLLGVSHAPVPRSTTGRGVQHTCTACPRLGHSRDSCRDPSRIFTLVGVVV